MGAATDPFRGGNCILHYGCGRILNSIGSLRDTDGKSRSRDVWGGERRCVASW